jgi:hypothetical protein
MTDLMENEHFFDIGTHVLPLRKLENSVLDVKRSGPAVRANNVDVLESQKFSE